MVVLSGCSGPEPAAHLEKTPQGHDYARLYMPSAKDVAIRIAWPTDWANRDDVNQAVPYIGSDLILSGGAEGYPADKVVETFADLKAEGSLSATPDHVLGELTVPKENVKQALEIANAHLRAPLLDQNWFERIRQGFARDAAEAASRPENKARAAVHWAVYGDVPLRRSLSIDPSQQIDAVTRGDILRWHKDIFTANTAMIVIAGNLDAKAAGDAVDALLSGLPEAPEAATHAKPKANFAPRRILLHVPDAKTSGLIFFAPLPPTRQGGEFEDMLLASALGGNDQSALFDAVRTKLRASYGFGAALDGFTRDDRILVLSGDVETAKIAAAEVAVRDAYAAFRKTGMSGHLADQKAPLLASIDAMSKTAGTAATSALLGLLDSETPDLVFKLKARLDDVTDVTLHQRLENAFPTLEQFTVVAVSPDAKALPDACVITRVEDAADC
jgi:predicted Zn-dependent peptidase